MLASLPKVYIANYYFKWQNNIKAGISFFKILLVSPFIVELGQELVYLEI